MPGKVNARNFRASCENEIYLTSTLKKTALDDFEHSCIHSQMFQFIILVVKLEGERAASIVN